MNPTDPTIMFSSWVQHSKPKKSYLTQTISSNSKSPMKFLYLLFIQVICVKFKFIRNQTKNSTKPFIHRWTKVTKSNQLPLTIQINSMIPKPPSKSNFKKLNSNSFHLKSNDNQIDFITKQSSNMNIHFNQENQDDNSNITKFTKTVVNDSLKKQIVNKQVITNQVIDSNDKPKQKVKKQKKGNQTKQKVSKNQQKVKKSDGSIKQTKNQIKSNLNQSQSDLKSTKQNQKNSKFQKQSSNSFQTQNKPVQSSQLKSKENQIQHPFRIPKNVTYQVKPTRYWMRL
ncbi:hypothetical protein BC833DRAFT_252201 [Globomyces pollinis-pini]|nr:hypothetical protein BC833DRAFT_252201 [Globomyces pollinis-pini]